MVAFSDLPLTRQVQPMQLLSHTLRARVREEEEACCMNLDLFNPIIALSTELCPISGHFIASGT